MSVTAREIGELYIDFVRAEGSEYKSKAWRICWCDVDGTWCLEQPLGREDAERALQALRRAGVTLEQFRALTEDSAQITEIDQVVAESLRW